MKFKDAMKIINKKTAGFRVHFEEVKNGMLFSGYFPEDGEQLIQNEDSAWDLAKRFADKTKSEGKYVNIYVIDQDFSPLMGNNTEYNKR